MTVPDEMAIPLGRAKIVFLVALSIGFVVLGLWMFNMNDTEILPSRDPLYVHGVGLAAIGFFGLCGAYGIRKIFDRRPGIQLTKKGIIDNSSGVALGLVAWPDILGFEVHKIRSTRFLTVKLVNPEKYLAASSSWQRRVNEMSMKMYGSPINLSSNALNIGFDELKALCEAYLSKYGIQKTAID